MSAKLGDDLMKVPKLEAGGTNWVIYKDRLLWSIDARGLLDHIDGSGEQPKCPVRPKFAPKRVEEGQEIGEMVQVPYVTISSFLLDYSICVLVDAFIRFMTRLFHVILLYSFYIALRSIAQRYCLA